MPPQPRVNFRLYGGRTSQLSQWGHGRSALHSRLFNLHCILINGTETQGSSGSMPKILSQDEIDAFRARLCTAAEKRFAAQGVAGVSLRQLAEDLGCSAMTPYRYFRDKDPIVPAVRPAALASFSA